MLYKSLIDTIGNTPMVNISVLSPNPDVKIWAKLEGVNPSGSVKDRIAKYMIERAEVSGDLKPGAHILEPSSGNTGIALAMIGRIKGYGVTVVMPASYTIERRQVLQTFGAEVVLSPGDLGSNGSVALATRMYKDNPGKYYMPFQYANPANPQAHYETTAPEIIRDLPDIDAFVAGLGTGGTLMGVGRRLREHNPKVQIVAVEPEQGEVVQGLRNLDGGFVPPIFDPNGIDSKIMVTNIDSVLAQRALMAKTGIWCGVSCGSAVYGAIRQAKKMAKGNIVTLLAEGGWKYLSSDLYTRDTNTLEDEMTQRLWW